MKLNYKMFVVVAVILVCGQACLLMNNGQDGRDFSINLSVIGDGWAENSVNATIFRKNSVVSSTNYQFVAYYDSLARVVIARRKHGDSKWELHTTQYSGNVRDAHNVISLMVDGDGYLHMSWDHHNTPLRYCRSVEPEGLQMGDMEPMIGLNEAVVSYPEFYRMNGGGVIFAYRDGGSGNGNMVLNRYELATRKWVRLQDNLIDGEGQRNAYWQIHVDGNASIHVSWVWRETPDVGSNHDMCYACSKDGGVTWMKSTGEQYDLPISESTAEVVERIPQNSNLINQTSMTADKHGNPYIATYYRASGDSCTQYHVIYRAQGIWKTSVATKRTLDFDLGGMGSRSIPVSRPQLLVMDGRENQILVLVYRDEEVENNILLVTSPLGEELDWTSQVISPYPVDRWEPSYDSWLLAESNKLHLYFQRVAQGQAETVVAMPPQPVGVLEVELNR
ncbi:MAG: BNR repeat-containing protein [Breznakibacter sp.]